ncbi:MAG: PEP-CTERM sorting domain-containing protein [Nitrospirae bacterium]|nr:PEP-CTERM sorting domain-containing protein [Nitrospirota bacterium]
MKGKTFIMRVAGKGSLVLFLILFLLVVFPAPSQSTIVNPRPDLFGSDDGTQLFDHCRCMAALEGYDLSDKGSYTGSTFGFFYWGTDLNDPNNFITLFDPADEIVNGQRPKASVDFLNGIVYDVDAGVIQDTFTPLAGHIGFFLEPDATLYPDALFTVASLNPGGVDAAATFPHLTLTKTYLLGYEIPNTNTTLAFEVVRGITPVPEPGTLYLLGAGLLLAAFLSRKSFSGASRKSFSGAGNSARRL